MSKIFLFVRVKKFELEEDEIVKRAQDWLGIRNHLNCQIEIEIVGRKRIQSLNKVFLNKDCPTDVLSFPLSPFPEKVKGQNLLGTIFICNDIIKNVNKFKYKKDLISLVKHGIDHLLGIHHD